MFVAVVQCETVLNDERSNPHVIRSNRSSLPAELAVNRCVLMRRFFVGEQHARSASSDELAQFALIFGLPFAIYESGAQFGDND